MTIKDRIAVNTLVEMWGCQKQPYTPWYQPPLRLSTMHVIFYAEGFIKLLGANDFILFSLSAEGTPINVAIKPQRDTQTIHGYFVQAMTQLGGIDVIVSDGGKAILAAAKALRQSLILGTTRTSSKMLF